VADETTPDAVEQAIAHLVNVLVSECSHTSETASALDVCIGNLRHAHHAERARHAEEVAEERRLKELKRQETVSLQGAVRKLMDQLEAEEARVAKLADCARNVADDRDSLRDQLHQATELVSVLEERLDAFEDTEPDARACAEWVIDIPQYGDTRQAARRYLSGVANRTATRLHRDVETLRDQLRKVEGERDVSRRQCGELHEHLALIVRYFEEETSAGDGIAEQHYAGYQLAKIVLARTAPNEAAWETAMVEFAQLQERASHVPGLSAALDEARHELDARRALDADVRACAEYCRNILIGPPGIPALAARRILAAIDSQGGEGE